MANPLLLPTERLAEALAAEWAAQVREIDPATMPLTRLVQFTLDGVASSPEPSGRRSSNMPAPISLLSRRRTAGARRCGSSGLGPGGRLGARGPGRALHSERRAGLCRAAAERHRGQAAALAGMAPLPLAAVHSMTTLTGSALLALAVARAAVFRPKRRGRPRMSTKISRCASGARMPRRWPGARPAGAICRRRPRSSRFMMRPSFPTARSAGRETRHGAQRLRSGFPVACGAGNDSPYGRGNDGCSAPHLACCHSRRCAAQRESRVTECAARARACRPRSSGCRAVSACYGGRRNPGEAR